jgi:MOSC domain-containing protein YiiM
MNGRIIQLNIKPKTGRERGLPKSPAPEIVVTASGVIGDFNKYRTERLASDPEMAVLIYPVEMLEKLNEERWAVKPGDLGENITTEGLSYDDYFPGGQYRAGGALLEVTKACDPCRNLALLPYVGQEKLKQFIRALIGRRGWYAKVIEGGTIRVGNTIRIISSE